MQARRADCRLGVFAVAVLALCCAAQAQRAFVVTASLSATRQSARLYAQTVDLGAGEVLPGGTALPGSSLLLPASTGGRGALSLSPGMAALSTGPSDPALHPDQGCPDTAVSLVHFRAPDVTAQCLYRSAGGWREWAAAVLPGTVTPGLLVLGRITAGPEDGPEVGRARLLGGASGTAAPPVEWSLPGVPVAGAWSERSACALVLCAGQAGSAPVLVKCVPGAPDTRWCRVDELPGWNPACTEARALFPLPGTGRCLVALSGRALGSGFTEPQTQVYLIDEGELAPVAGPVAVRGMADHMDGTDAAGVWVASHAPGSDFAYATRLRIAATDVPGAAAEVEYALTGALDGFLLDPDPATGTVAAALGARLELWPGGIRGETRQEYDNPIRELCWAGDGLLVGEAGRVHVADPVSGAPLKTVQLQTGHVSAILPAPAPAGKRALPRPGNRLVLPSSVLLRGEAAGRELRALRIECEGAPGPWRVSYDASQMPWLVLHPVSGIGSGSVFMGVDPARYRPHTLAEGEVTVSLEGGSPPVAALDSPASVPVRVVPSPAAARTVLWLWPDAGPPMRDPSDPRGVARLAGQLAAPPQCFSHAESFEPVSGPLRACSVVVLHAGAALRGLLPRQALVDYVADGGGLLVVGGNDKAEAESLAPWLAPFGVGASAEPPPGPNPGVTGVPSGIPEPLRSWPAMAMPAAYGFRTAADAAQGAFAPPAMKVLQVPATPAGATSLFLARPFGYGRVVLLASDAVLRTASGGGAAADFARELFNWLATAGLHAQDMDRDGLTDDLEDANGNGAQDPGETDWLHADTDRDGVPDGLEDWNRNGAVDPGETDPRNPDSDGDGAWDGADPGPAPVFDAPRIAGVVPYAGPAEGGGMALVRGEGLLPGAEYRFGDQPAECIAPGNGKNALVRVPEFGGDGGGEVTVSVVLPGRGLRAELPRGYLYQPRSHAGVTLVPMGAVTVEDGVARGRFRVVLSVNPPCATAVVSFQLDPPEVAGFSWHPERPASPAMRARVTGGGGIDLDGEAHPTGAEGVVLAEIGWSATAVPGTVFTFAAPRGMVQSPTGNRIGVAVSGLEQRLP